MVAPTGSTNLAILLSTWLFSNKHLKVIGSVAELQNSREAHTELFLFLGNRTNCSKPSPGRVNFTLTMWALLLIPWSARVLTYRVTRSFVWGRIKTVTCINARVNANFASPKLKTSFSFSFFLKKRDRNPTDAVLYTQMQDRRNTLCSLLVKSLKTVVHSWFLKKFPSRSSEIESHF